LPHSQLTKTKTGAIRRANRVQQLSGDADRYKNEQGAHYRVLVKLHQKQ